MTGIFARAIRCGAAFVVLASVAWAGTLSDETEKTLTRFRSGDPDAYEAVGAAPEYKEVASVMIDVLKEKDHGLHNNACLALEELIRRHEDLKVEVDPVLDCITHRVFTCQQKGAQVIRDSLNKDANWLKTRKDDAIERLIPLTASQRSRVYEAALACLEKLTSQKIGRDPIKWEAWFNKTHRKKLDLAGCVYEILCVIDTRSGYELNGKKVTDLATLKKELAQLNESAKKAKLELGTVVVVEASVLESHDMAKVQAATGAVMGALQEVGIGDMTVAPPQDTFLPPVKELLERKPKKS